MCCRLWVPYLSVSNVSLDAFGLHILALHQCTSQRWWKWAEPRWKRACMVEEAQTNLFSFFFFFVAELICTIFHYILPLLLHLQSFVLKSCLVDCIMAMRVSSRMSSLFFPEKQTEKRSLIECGEVIQCGIPKMTNFTCHVVEPSSSGWNRAWLSIANPCTHIMPLKSQLV